MDKENSAERTLHTRFPGAQFKGLLPDRHLIDAPQQRPLTHLIRCSQKKSRQTHIWRLSRIYTIATELMLTPGLAIKMIGHLEALRQFQG